MTAGTRAALDAAIDEYGSAAYDLGYVLHDPHEDARRRPRRDAARVALDRAIASHLEAIAADRARLDAEWQAHDHGRDVEVARAQADAHELARTLLAICRSVGVHSVPTGEGWGERVIVAVTERIAADRARAVAEAVEAETKRLVQRMADEVARAVESVEDAAFIRGRDAVRKHPDGWGLMSRPTPDEARRLVSTAINAGMGLAYPGNWTDEQRLAADERAEAARTALLRALGVEA